MGKEEKKREKETRKKEERKLWEVEDVLTSRGSGEEREVLVRWKEDGSQSWVPLSHNRELDSYLLASRASPYASTLSRGEIKTYAPEYRDILALTCAIFEKLSTRSTVAGDVRVSAAVVEIPFSLESLRKFLGGRNFNAGSVNLSGCLPVDFPCWHWELDPCFTSLGIFTDRLCYQRNFDTTTYCEVDPNKMMKLS